MPQVIHEPAAVAVIGISSETSSIVPGTSSDGERSCIQLFVRPRDSTAAQWDEARSEPDAARVLNADELCLDLLKVQHRSNDQNREKISTCGIARTQTSNHQNIGGPSEVYSKRILVVNGFQHHQAKQNR